jgi:hypothetical protein
MLQSKAGIQNKEYAAQRDLLAEVDAGKLPLEELLTRGHELIKERLASTSRHWAPTITSFAICIKRRQDSEKRSAAP